MNWKPVAPGTLLDWLGQQMQAPPPASYELAAPSEASSGMDEIGVFTRVREDSGTVELEFGPGVSAADALELAQIMAQTYDRRSFLAEEASIGDERGSWSREARSWTGERLVLADLISSIEGVQVVGPGGRFTLYGGPGRMTADFTIRRRLRAERRATSWRHPEAIAARTLVELGPAPAHIELRVVFGYFEASKYERQTWLAPVFVFVLEQPQREGGGPRWRIAFTEQATSVDVQLRSASPAGLRGERRT